MSNIIGTKEHLFVYTMNKKGQMVQHEVKKDRAHYKLIDQLSSKYSQERKMKNKLDTDK